MAIPTAKKFNFIPGADACSATIWMASRIASFGNAPQTVIVASFKMFPNITPSAKPPSCPYRSDGLDPARPTGGGPLRAHSERTVPPPKRSRREMLNLLATAPGREIASAPCNDV
jgi:hypothetical protein